MDRPDIARLTKAKQDIRVIESALNLYKLDKFNYPTTEEGLEILQPKYLDRLPKNPWGNVYLYLSPDERSAVDIFNYGADSMNADLGNWDTD